MNNSRLGLVRLAQHPQAPVVVDVVLERTTTISMGTEIDNVVEFEELAARGADVPSAITMLDRSSHQDQGGRTCASSSPRTSSRALSRPPT